MATVFNNLPGVRRKEVDASDVLVPRIGNTVGTVIRSYKGPIKQPVVVTSESDFVNVFGAPSYTSAVSTQNVGGLVVEVPDYGYGAYGVLEVLKETSSVIVVRGFDKDGGDKYATAVANLDTTITSANTYGVSAVTGGNAGAVPTNYVVGDPFDSPTYISTIDTSASALGVTTTNRILVSYVSPSKQGNNVGVVVEMPSVSADWLYTYDGYPTLPSGTELSAAWNLSASEYFPIASNMVKVSVFEKPDGRTWEDLYTTSADREETKIRLSPVEVFYGTLYDVLDTEQNSLFIEDVINGRSNYIYTKTVKKADKNTPAIIATTASSYVAPYGIDSTGSFYVKNGALIKMAGGLTERESGIGTEDMDLWDIFKNRREVEVDILMSTSWNATIKRKVAEVVASRMDCFAELQSNQPQDYTVAQVLAAEQYGYIAPSYVGLAVGFSKVYDSFNSKYVWLPNVIFETAVDLRSTRLTNPWTAPAGTNRAILGVDGQLKTYSDPELDQLIGRNLNPVSYERGYGYVVWSQRTAQMKKSALDRKNVRFNLLYIENNIEIFLKQFIFENNTEQTRQRCYDGVYTFLKGVELAGGLYQFDVVCDDTNNTSAVIDANQLNVDIYVSPTKSAEIINFTTIVTKTGASLNSVRLQYA